VRAKVSYWTINQTIPWHSCFVTSLSPWRPGGNPRPAHVESVVNKVDMAHFFLWVHQLTLPSASFNQNPILIHSSSKLLILEWV